jgi:hypothetical protein
VKHAHLVTIPLEAFVARRREAAAEIGMYDAAAQWSENPFPLFVQHAFEELVRRPVVTLDGIPPFDHPEHRTKVWVRVNDACREIDLRNVVDDGFNLAALTAEIVKLAEPQ